MEIIFLIPIAALAAATFIVKWSLEYSKWKRQFDRGGSPADNSLGTSELKTLIREAMEEANAPLHERIAALEQRLDGHQHDLLTGTDGYLTDVPNAPERQPVR